MYIAFSFISFIQVGEVRLFGEEEIQRDLFLVVCEWPTDDTRVVIHGYW